MSGFRYLSIECVLFDRVGETSEIEEAKLEGTENSAYQQTSSETTSLYGHAQIMNGYGTAANGLALSETASDNFIGMLLIVTK